MCGRVNSPNEDAEMEKLKIREHVALVIFLTAIVTSILYLIRGPMSAETVFLYDHAMGTKLVTYTLPYILHGGLDIFWFDLFGWSVLAGIFVAIWNRLSRDDESRLRKALRHGIQGGLLLVLFGVAVTALALVTGWMNDTLVDGEQQRMYGGVLEGFGLVTAGAVLVAIVDRWLVSIDLAVSKSWYHLLVGPTAFILLGTVNVGLAVHGTAALLFLMISLAALMLLWGITYGGYVAIRYVSHCLEEVKTTPAT